MEVNDTAETCKHPKNHQKTTTWELYQSSLFPTSLSWNVFFQVPIVLLCLFDVFRIVNLVAEFKYNIVFQPYLGPWDHLHFWKGAKTCQNWFKKKKNKKNANIIFHIHIMPDMCGNPPCLAWKHGEASEEQHLFVAGGCTDSPSLPRPAAGLGAFHGAGLEPALEATQQARPN